MAVSRIHHTATSVECTFFYIVIPRRPGEDRGFRDPVKLNMTILVITCCHHRPFAASGLLNVQIVFCILASATLD